MTYRRDLKCVADIASSLIRSKIVWVSCCLGLLASCGGRTDDVPRVEAPPRLMAAAVVVNDVMAIAGERNDYTIRRTETGYTVTDNVGNTGSVAVTGAKSLKFSDLTVNLTIGDKSRTISPDDLTTLIELYIAYFNRVPDADGMSYWIDQIKAGWTFEQIGASFYQAALQNSTTTGYSPTATNEDFVRIVYKNVLNRSDPDVDGVAYWTKLLNTGAATRGTLVRDMLASAHNFKGHATYGWVYDYLVNKVTVGRYIAIEQGVTYNSATDSITKGIAIAAAVTPWGTQPAKDKIGTGDTSSSFVTTCKANEVLQQGKCVVPPIQDALGYPTPESIEFVCGSDNSVWTSPISSGPCAWAAALYIQENACKRVQRKHVVQLLQCVVAQSTGTARTDYANYLENYLANTPACDDNRILVDGQCVLPERKNAGDYPIDQVTFTCEGSSTLWTGSVPGGPCNALIRRSLQEQTCGKEVKSHTIERLQCMVDYSEGAFKSEWQDFLNDYVLKLAATCSSTQTLVDGVCVAKPPVCSGNQILENGVCVTPSPSCTGTQVLKDGVCVPIVPTCTPPMILKNNVCVTPPPTCNNNERLVGNTCVQVTVQCTSPQILIDGTCTTPPPTCPSPQILKNNVCVTPTPTCTSPDVLENGKCVQDAGSNYYWKGQVDYKFTCPYGRYVGKELSVRKNTISPCRAEELEYQMQSTCDRIPVYDSILPKDTLIAIKNMYQCYVNNSSGSFKDKYQVYLNETLLKLSPPTTTPSPSGPTTNCYLNGSIPNKDPKCQPSYTPTCTPPKVLQNGVCVTPSTTPTTCKAPNVVVGNTCVAPPSSTGRVATQCVRIGYKTSPYGPSNDSQTLTNICSERIAIDWCHTRSSRPGTRGTECNDEGKYYQQFSKLEPGETYDNFYSLPVDAKIMYGACFGTYGAIVQDQNGYFHCKN